jgi:hypothetical protein
MATTQYNATFGPANLEIPAGTAVVLTRSTDSGLSRFEAVWTTPRGPVTGVLPSRNLIFSAQEIQHFGFPVDSNGMPLFQGQPVTYVGATIPGTVVNGATLIVRDPQSRSNPPDCECVHEGAAPPNTTGEVMVRCSLLARR